MKYLVFFLFLITSSTLSPYAIAQEAKTVEHSSGGWIQTGPKGYIANTYTRTNPNNSWLRAVQKAKPLAKLALKRFFPITVATTASDIFNYYNQPTEDYEENSYYEDNPQSYTTFELIFKEPHSYTMHGAIPFEQDISIRSLLFPATPW